MIVSTAVYRLPCREEILCRETSDLCSPMFKQMARKTKLTDKFQQKSDRNLFREMKIVAQVHDLCGYCRIDGRGVATDNMTES